MVSPKLFAPTCTPAAPPPPSIRQTVTTIPCRNCTTWKEGTLGREQDTPDMNSDCPGLRSSHVIVSRSSTVRASRLVPSYLSRSLPLRAAHSHWPTQPGLVNYGTGGDPPLTLQVSRLSSMHINWRTRPTCHHSQASRQDL